MAETSDCGVTESRVGLRTGPNSGFTLSENSRAWSLTSRNAHLVGALIFISIAHLTFSKYVDFGNSLRISSAPDK